MNALEGEMLQPRQYVRHCGGRICLFLSSEKRRFGQLTRPKLGAETDKVVAPHQSERFEEGRAEGGDGGINHVKCDEHGGPSVGEDGERTPSTEVRD